jgi:hypothetical protein
MYLVSFYISLLVQWPFEASKLEVPTIYNKARVRAMQMDILQK